MMNENMVTLNINNLEAFGFTGMNKQQLEAAIKTSIQCQLTFTTAKGEKIELTSYFVPEIDNIVVTDEEGYEIQNADNLEATY
ncbi:hypothetical protein FB550_102449 [Neobacillus bataviensis]|uniref:Uncharacterized protein n=1 Tax=Neobacillus bataviensis TaxID=220685 RepID=A0A561DSV2_9BACI|nr:hypothetical protein [Neobacillus bataviensis]TWE06427.1 hypothetical protein FB550_102449 [Neobacillus bataviensis]